MNLRAAMASRHERLDSRLPLSGEHAGLAEYAGHLRMLRYLRGEAGETGARWRVFMQALRAGVRTPEEIAEACAGACAAFDSIIELGLREA